MVAWGLPSYRTDRQRMFSHRFHRFSQMVRVWNAVNSAFCGNTVLPRIALINTDGWLRGYGRDAIPSYICVNPCYLWETLLYKKVLCRSVNSVGEYHSEKVLCKSVKSVGENHSEKVLCKSVKSVGGNHSKKVL